MCLQCTNLYSESEHFLASTGNKILVNFVIKKSSALSAYRETTAGTFL